MPLSHNQEILFTRQRHEAERAGLHYDYRIVVGDKAFSWATKKQLPSPGTSILLHEQPIHTADYALSERVEIPKGQYGAGVTTLDWVGKGRIDNPEEDKEKFVVNLNDGQRFLIKKLPQKYGPKAWLFKNLSKEQTITKEKLLEKSASLILGAGLTHLAQNIGTQAAMRSKKVAKYLANSFSQGAHGVVDTSLKARATRFLSGVALPEVAVAHKEIHGLGSKMKPILDKATPRQKVALRMISEGRFSDLRKYKLHKDPIVQSAHNMISKVTKTPSLGKMIDNSKKVEPLFKDKSHPLLSNISKNISRGEKPVGSQFKPGHLTAKAPIAGAMASTLVDPAGGIINSTKTLMSSEKFGQNRFGAKIKHMLNKQFVTNPIKSGVSTSKTGHHVNELKHKANSLIVNPVSAELKRTSASITDALRS